MKGGRNPGNEEQALAFSQGDTTALAHFFEQLHPALSLYANRFVQDRALAEEIASTAFVKTWKSHHKLDTYPAIRAYLYRAVHNGCVDEIKAQGRRTEAYNIYTSNTEDPHTALDDLVRIEVYAQLHQAMKGLSPGNRKVIYMHFIEGKTTAEIAKELQVSDSTVKTLKYRGLKALRKKMEGGMILLLINLMV
jgi:RNA polymerase sigma-70 factor (family 1)